MESRYVLVSDDKKTIKYLQKTGDNHIIETGYYNLDEHIVCISSQIGCPLDCIFCATTAPVDSFKPNKHFIRNLTFDEITQQVENVLQQVDRKKLKSKRILFSYMGMGEPFLNYKNVVKSIKSLSKKFPNSRTTISTIGIKSSLMKKLAHEEIDTILKMHLSLHAPEDNLRNKIMPKAYNIEESLEALKYFSLTRNITAKVNYMLIKNINDSKKYAVQLAELLQDYPFTVKLSKLNEFNKLESSNADKFGMFREILNSYGIKVSKFVSKGTDIQAGCGQLRRHFYKKILKVDDT